MFFQFGSETEKTKNEWYADSAKTTVGKNDTMKVRETVAWGELWAAVCHLFLCSAASQVFHFNTSSVLHFSPNHFISCFPRYLRHSPYLRLLHCHSSSVFLSTHLSVISLHQWIIQPFMLFSWLLPLIFISSQFIISSFCLIFVSIPQVLFLLCCITAFHSSYYFSSLPIICKCHPVALHHQ